MMMSPTQLPPRSPDKIAENQIKMSALKQKIRNESSSYPTIMRACVCTRYGRLTEVDVPSLMVHENSIDAPSIQPIFRVQNDIPKPEIEDAHHVLIRNLRTTVNPADCKQRAGNLELVTGHTKRQSPKNKRRNRETSKDKGAGSANAKTDRDSDTENHDQKMEDHDEDDQRTNFPLLILGQDFAGIVETVGSKVKSFRVGDAVFGSTAPRNSCAADYVRAFDYECAHKPAHLAWDEAAAAPTAFCTAWKGLFDPQLGNLTVHPIEEEGTAIIDDNAAEQDEKEKVEQIQTYVVDEDDEDERPPRVLVVGASGSVGSAAVQLAKQIAKAEVAAICGPQNVDYVKSLGASPVFDYTNAEYEIYYQDNEDERFDVIFDCVGGDSYYYKLHPFLNKRDLKNYRKNASTAAVLCNQTNPSTYVTCVGPVMHAGSERVTYGRIAQTATTLVPRFFGNYILPGQWNSRYKIFLSFTTQNGVLEQVQQALDFGKVRPRVDPISPLSMEQLGSGHYQVEQGHSNGKVVIAIQDE